VPDPVPASRPLLAPRERPARLLVVGAGPGDADRAFGGSVAAWVADGCVAQLVCCTSGDASGEDPAADPLQVAARREREQRAAASILGYEDVTFLHQPEGALANTLALREHLVRILRAFRPDAVAAPDPRDVIRADGTLVSPDVRAAGEAAIDALDASRRVMAFPSLVTADGLAPHRVARLFLYGSERADAVVDIAGGLDRKAAALAGHADKPEGADELVAWAREAAATIGATAGVAAGEACAAIDVRH
jgi:LmbE family N-acetylglucosaminyl deacetylase